MKSVGSFGILSFLLVHLCILKSTDAVTTAELDLYRRVKPVLTSSDVYADAAKFTVDIQNPIGGRFVKCGNLGTHVVQLAPPSNPSEYSFAYNVSNRGDGFIVGNLAPNTDYIVRVACRFNNEGSPGYWSDPISIRTREWTSKGDGSGHHHHYDHDHQQDGGGGGRSKFGGQEAQSNRSPSTTTYSLFIVNHMILFLLIHVLLASTNFY